MIRRRKGARIRHLTRRGDHVPFRPPRLKRVVEAHLGGPMKGLGVSVSEVARQWQPVAVGDLLRFSSKIIYLPSGCHQWTGRLDSGYGRFWCNGKTLLAHRVAWELDHGPVPAGLQLDHLCRNRGCVNPVHLEPVSLKTNVLRGAGITATNLKKTHCVRGHPLAGSSLYVTKSGHRTCRTCAVGRTRDWRMGRQV